MSFNGSVSLATGAQPLPVMTDAANGRTTTLFSHMQFTVGGTAVFDSKSTVTITGVAGNVIAIPTAARTVTLGSSATALLGKMD